MAASLSEFVVDFCCPFLVLISSSNVPRQMPHTLRVKSRDLECRLILKTTSLIIHSITLTFAYSGRIDRCIWHGSGKSGTGTRPGVPGRSGELCRPWTQTINVSIEIPDTARTRRKVPPLSPQRAMPPIFAGRDPNGSMAQFVNEGISDAF